MSNYYFNFVKQLDQFIDKYYKNALLKGILWSLGGILSLYIILNVLEYYFYFSTQLRFCFLLLFFLIAFLLLFFFVLNPIAKLFGLSKRLSYTEAVKKLALFFPESEDKMLNILDLQTKFENPNPTEEVSLDLLRAAIDQKVLSFKAYRFVNAIKVKVNLKYVKYLSIPVVLILFLLIFYPQTLVKSSNRILHFNQKFEREYPFKIKILNSQFVVLYQEDFLLQIEVSGDKIPHEIFVLVEGQAAKCKQVDLTHFVYTFKSVTQNINFKILADKYVSGEYTLSLAPKPLLRSLRMKIKYPSYISKESLWVDAIGNTSVPEGSNIEWFIDVQHSDSISFMFYENEKKYTLLATKKQKTKKDTRFVFQKTLHEKFPYALSAYHPQALSLDTVSYQIDVIPDAYPSIQVSTFEDSLLDTRRFFRILLSDDYACKYLVFVVNTYDKDQVLVSQQLDSLLILPNRDRQEVSYFFDLLKYNLMPGQRLEYFFWVYDNDAYHGYKKTSSTSFSFYKKSQEELLLEVNKQAETLDKSMKKSLSAISAIKTDFDKMSKQLTEKTNLNWEDKKAFEQLLKEQKNILNDLKNFANQIKSKLEKEKQLSEIDPTILEKEKQLEALFKEIFDDNMQKQLEEIEKLLKENVSRETLTEKMENMKLKQQELAKELNRNLDIYKQLEFEKKFDKGIEDISKLQTKLAQLQKELQEKNNAANKEELLQKQKEAMQDLNILKQDLNKLDAMNQVLNEPNQFTNPSQKLESVQKKMNTAIQKIDAQKNTEAAQADKEAQEELAQMAQSMEDEMELGQAEEQAEDAASIRVLLKSILRTSFSQEALMQKLQTTTTNNPLYPDIIRAQSVLRTEILQIADTINAIAVRQPAVAVYTQKEVKQVLSYSRDVLASLLQMNEVFYQRANLRNNEALSGQQYVMTSLNNLSLLLTESLDKMNKQAKKGKGKNGKPSTSNESAKSGKKPSAKDMQDALNTYLKELKKRMEGKNSQQEGEKGMPGMSEAFARAAARQEMIRQMMQEQYKSLMSKNPKMAGEFNKIMGEMEKTETDLVNKILNEQTLRRQENIQSRLLEAEKADLEREQEMKRESKEAKSMPVNSPALEEFLKQKNKINKDVLRKEIPNLKKYYKEKVDIFFR
ncbi:MAG: hypothetical protein RSC04_00090 [Bacteroidales bacterium]